MTARASSDDLSRAGEVRPVIVMGVSGSGKSTIGSALAAAIGSAFIDGDDLHPSTNKVKMSRGVLLTDDDRAPWLEAVAARICAELAQGRPLVVACSALKKRYRTRLVEGAPSTVFVHLAGEQALIAGRLALRRHEFMSNTLLDSQFLGLEPLDPDERGIVVDLAQAPEDIVAEAVAGIRALQTTRASASARRGECRSDPAEPFSKKEY